MASRYLYESFAGTALHPGLRWFCEPRRWAIVPAEQRLRVEPDGGTDFWQRTHYGYQYDQAGLMARLSSRCWIKTSVEYEPDGPSRLGVVVTRDGYSDWSTQDFPPGPGEVWLRVRREAGAYLVDASRDGIKWLQLRLTHLHDDQGGVAVACGLYACSPRAAGFVAEFAGLSIDLGRLAAV